MEVDIIRDYKFQRRRRKKLMGAKPKFGTCSENVSPPTYGSHKDKRITTMQNLLNETLALLLLENL